MTELRKSIIVTKQVIENKDHHGVRHAFVQEYFLTKFQVHFNLFRKGVPYIHNKILDY